MAVVQNGVESRWGWLNSDADVSVGDLLRAFPSIVRGRYLAISSWDSGAFRVEEVLRQPGWHAKHEVAYSPLIAHDNDHNVGLPNEEWPTFCELYASLEPLDLGMPPQNEFEQFDPNRGHYIEFVNFLAFDLTERDGYLASLFWKQMDWIQPESYLAESNDWIAIAHIDREVLSRVREWLEMAPSRIEGESAD